MKEIKLGGETKSYSGFFDFVANTTRQQRNNLLGSAVVYSVDFDAESVETRVTNLIKQHEKCLEGLRAIKPLIELDVRNAQRRKEALSKLQQLSIEELEALTEK